VSEFVLDASALIALINSEKGCDQVEQYINKSCISSVNISEVAGILHDILIPETEIETILGKLITNIIPFDEQHAYETAKLKSKTKKYGLSFGDRACLSLGIIKKLPVITADKIWNSLEIGVKVIMIR